MGNSLHPVTATHQLVQVPVPGVLERSLQMVLGSLPRVARSLVRTQGGWVRADRLDDVMTPGGDARAGRGGRYQTLQTIRR